MSDIKIVFDAGHGYQDPGGVGNGLKEKELVLSMAKYAKEYLDKHYEGHEIKMTRTGDTFPTLSERTKMANSWGADLFVSFHTNAASGTAKGFETFVFDKPSANSLKLQDALHKEILSAMKEFGAITDRGQKKGNLHVVRETNMPAVLTESLFIDNKDDAKLLKNEKFVKMVGEAHAVAVAKYAKLPEKTKVVAKQTIKKEASGTMYRVVTGSFSDKNKAEKRAKDLKAKGFDSFLEAYKK